MTFAEATPIVYRPPSYVERLDLSALFPKSRPVEVELGAGDGSFILQWAAMNPERNFVAVERLLGRLMKIEKRGSRAALKNLRGIRLEASYFTERLLPGGAINAFHIYFPDPWPKLRHRANRLVNGRFTGVLKSALAPGGIVYLRTDDEDYFAQMTRVFRANSDFAFVETPERLKEVTTDFEREFTAKGIATNRAAYQRLH